MTLKEAWSVCDKIVCHTCQCVTKHDVNVEFEEDTGVIIVFTCKECGEETDENTCDIAV